MYEVLFYEGDDGNCPVDDFLDGLAVNIRAKVEKWMEKLEEEGPNLPRPYADLLRDKIRELRINFGTNNYRILYFFNGKEIVMTHAFVKKTRGVPDAEIERAKIMMKDYKRRKKWRAREPYNSG